MEPLHPTAERFIATVSDMLDGQHPHSILVDDVLAASGISRGALYHHFGDFPGLIETTLLRRFSINVDADLAAIQATTEQASSFEDYWARIRELSALTQLPSRAPARAERARILALAATNERFGTRLAEEQERLTDQMALAIRQAQEHGWVRNDLDARAIAVLLQAYSLGRIVDDISLQHMGNEQWIAVIDSVLSALQARA